MEDETLPSAPSENGATVEVMPKLQPNDAPSAFPDVPFKKSDLAFAKIVATPTLTSWSQAYNAGRLFAVLSLSKNVESQEDLLPPLGKEILRTLEEEYYTLETKNLATIKEAVLTTRKKIPTDVSTSFVVASIIENILYVFVLGDAKAILKRGEKVGVILDAKNTVSENVPFAAASGYLTDGDIIVLETAEFAKLVTTDMLYEALAYKTPAEIAETLSPLLHENGNGGATAFVLQFAAPTEEKEEVEQMPIEESTPSAKFSLPAFNLSFLKRLSLPRGLTHRRRMFISLAVVLGLVLAASVFFAMKKQEEAKTKALFAQTFTKAQKKYEEGTALLSLNKNLAREDFQEAKNILEDANGKFPKGTSEEKQVIALQKQIDDSLTKASSVNKTAPQAVSDLESPLLSYEKKNTASAFAQDNTNIYFVDSAGVSSVDKETSKAKRIIVNNKYWSEPFGLGLYLTNIYVMDKKSNQVIKFVSALDGYGKTNYFKSDVDVDLSNAQGMAVDTSVWILFADGGIKKFTRGAQDSLSISGLEEPLKSPTKIFTNVDTKNLYILDKGNSRVVVLNKEGAYVAQYQAGILSNAQDFDVQETDKKIFVLSSSKIWEIPIK